MLSAAAKQFRANGYAAVSLRAIAKAAGLTTGSMYYHFKSKEDIVGEVLFQGHLIVLDQVKATLDNIATDDHEARLRGAIKTHILCLFGEDSLPAANIRIFSQVPQEVRSGAMATRRAYEALWIGLLEQAQRAGQIRANLSVPILLPLMLGAINWTTEWSNGDEDSLETIVTELMLLIQR